MTPSSPNAVGSSLDSNGAHATASGVISEPSGSAISSADTGMIVSTYYPDWVASEFPPEKIDFNRFNWVDFAFAIPDENLGLRFTQPNSEELLVRLVSVAHSQFQKVKLSIGGWLGSQYFSRAVRTESARATFAQSILDVYERFGLDGVDLDWEYPNSSGAGENEFTPQDAANYLAFLKVLRGALPSSAKITAAVALWPFNDENGRPMEDVSAFGEVLDWIVIMNYDVFGSSSTEPGPNAPLSDGCGDSRSREANARSGVERWIRAGVASRKIVLGVPLYGVLSRSDVQRLVHRREEVEEGEKEECDFGFECDRDQGDADADVNVDVNVDADDKRGVDDDDRDGGNRLENGRDRKGSLDETRRVRRGKAGVQVKVAGSGGGRGMEERKIYRKNGGGGGSKGGGGARGKASGSDPGSGHSGSSGNSGSSDRGQSEGISMEIEAGSRNEDRVGAVAGGRDRRSGATAGAMKTV
ncbi:hypothetical protein FRC19_005776, partial [Serendipita sp. 401]